MIQESKKIREFTDLISWQEAHKVVLLVYKASAEFPKSELFGLVSQMRRCSVSISSNIAEGFGKQTLKEKIQFYYQSQGSLIELKNQLLISKDVGYINEKTFDIISEQIITAHKLLQGLITKTKLFLNHKS